MENMRYRILALLAVLLGLTACLKDFEDTSFVPEKAVISWGEESKTLTKDATTFELVLHSNLPWRITPSASWLSVSPERGLGDAVLTVKVAKNRTVEERRAYLRMSVTADQYSDFPVVQGPAEGGDSNTYYVKADGDPSASGLSWTNATTLDAAIDQAADGDVIYVAAGTYSPGAFLENSDENDPSNKTFQIHSNFVLQGGFPATADDAGFDPVKDYDPSSNVTTLSGAMDGGNAAYHVVTVTAAALDGKKALLKGFTITGGKTGTVDKEGYMVGGSLVDKSRGGGLNVGASRIDIEDCIISGNEAQMHAAGVFLNARGEVSMTACRIIANESKNNAGGIWNSGATLWMDRCTVAGNISGQQAAGLYSINSEGVTSVCRIFNSTFSGNDCTTVNAGRSGGGAYIREFSDVVFVNCTFQGNKAGNGGAVQGYGGNGKTSRLSLISCTLSGNSATVLGGGISLWNNYNTLNIYNCIISGNSAPSGENIGIGANANAPKLDYYTTIVGSGLFSQTGTAVSGWTFDPATMLSAFGLWGGKTETFSLVDGAANPAASEGMTREELAAIGAGFSPAVSASVFETDQRGVAREKNTIGSTTL